MPNKIYVPGLLAGRRKRRSKEIVTGINVPARGKGDPTGPESVARARAVGAP